MGICVLALSGALSSCDDTVKIKNGELPDNMVASAAKLLGTYTGVFGDSNNTLNVALIGNKLIVTPQVDLLGSACHSQLGNLKEVAYHTDDNQAVVLDEVDFDFDSVDCIDVIGSTLALTSHVNSHGALQFDAQLLRDYRITTVYIPGGEVCSTDSHGHTSCYQTPGHWINESNPEYIFGNFRKSS